MVYPADRIMEIREARKLGIAAAVDRVDFRAIMERMRGTVKHSHDRIRESLEKAEDFDFHPGEARFTGDHTLEVNGRSIQGKTIFLVSGARPFIPAIQGIDQVPFLTNESALQLRDLPASMVIVGGGYIAVEFAHFFEAIGAKVTVIQKNQRLVPDEEPEISELLRTSLSQRMTVHTATEAIEARTDGGKITVRSRSGNDTIDITADSLLLAAGRKSNADLLQVEKTGVKTDERGYIVVDDFFETTKKGIWSFGDAIGKKMYRHAANHEADLAWHNAVHGKKSRMNYLTVPHAVFSWPEIASVGLREEQAVKVMGREQVLVGTARYADVARGEAMMETASFAKAVVHRKSGKILGYHIIGPQASVLIQEVVNAMAGDGTIWSVAKGIHIHPALSEVVLKAFAKLREPA
jgi:mycothione reductase